jgi:hypothetical protein
LAWGVQPMPTQESLMEFHFIKNDNEDSVKNVHPCIEGLGSQACDGHFHARRFEKESSWFHLFD